MAHFRPIDVRIWNDARFMKLSDDGKLMFLLVLTHPGMTMLGAMRGTIAGLAAELGWPAERGREAFSELLNADHALVEHDEQARFIGLPNFLKYQPPANGNVVKSWREPLELIPECDLKTQLIQRIRAHVRSRGPEFVAALETVLGTVAETVSRTVCQTVPRQIGKPSRNGLPNGMANQEQNQNQEQQQEQEPDHKETAIAAGEVPPIKALKVKETGKTQEPIPIPTELDTPEFHQAWTEWKEHLQQKRKPMKPLQESKQLSTWAANGVERTIAAINHSIANGWQGLFEPNAASNGQRSAAMSQSDPYGNLAALAEYRRRKAAAGIGGTEHDAQVD